MERLRKLREPVAIVLLAATAAQIVLVIAAVGYYAVVAGATGAGYLTAGQLSGTLVIVTTLVLIGCAVWGRPTPHARMLLVLGAVDFGARAVLAFVLAIVGLVETGGALAMVGVLLEVLIPALAAVVLFALHADLPSGQPSAGPGQFQPRIQPSRSQSDQFGNPYSNSGRPNAEYPGADPGQHGWQPVAQPGPHRLEPSPYTPPVGPHSRPEDAQNPSESDSQPGPRV